MRRVTKQAVAERKKRYFTIGSTIKCNRCKEPVSTEIAELVRHKMIECRNRYRGEER
jgi:formylmethanofuran dehydrogenase subunit E